LRDLQWAGDPAPGTVLVQCSAHGPARPAVVDGTVVRWAEPQRRVAPGQSVVIYDGADELVLGGGIAG
jgi:tRNA-specific 2-thiouridylase